MIVQKPRKTTVIRLITVFCLAAISLAIAFVVITFDRHGELYPCAINGKFHLHCPTCGTTRAVYYFFTLRFKEAFYYHAYFVSLSPLMAYAVIALCVNGIAAKKIMPLPFKWYYPVIFIAGLFLFGIFRNFTSVIY